MHPEYANSTTLWINSECSVNSQVAFPSLRSITLKKNAIYVYIYTGCFSGINLAPLEFNELSYFYSGVIVNINWLAQVIYFCSFHIIS